MTDDELARIEKQAKWQLETFVSTDALAADAPTLLALVAEVRRLRGLVKAAEWASGYQSFHSVSCPWCDADNSCAESHAPHCPAFTPDGAVR